MSLQSRRVMRDPPGRECQFFVKQKRFRTLFCPDSFDKFAAGGLQIILSLFTIDTLIICGYRSNNSMLSAANMAVRELKYNVIIPIHVIDEKTEYEQEYTSVQMSMLPTHAARRFRFTNPNLISSINTTNHDSH